MAENMPREGGGGSAPFNLPHLTECKRYCQMSRKFSILDTTQCHGYHNLSLPGAQFTSGYHQVSMAGTQFEGGYHSHFLLYRIS